jgi:hypothetical protein
MLYICIMKTYITFLLATVAATFAQTKNQPKTAPARPELKKRERVIPNGCRLFTFPDGFQCIASNQRNAQRKWANHLEAVNG